VSRIKIHCVIPIRSGSKRIKNKNFLPVFGLSLYQITLLAAAKSKIFDTIILAYEDESELDFKFCDELDITPYKRQERNALDHSSAEDLLSEVVDHFELLDSDWITLLQVTNPLHAKKYFSELYTKILSKNFTSIFSVVKSRRFLQDEVQAKQFERERTQDRGGYFLETGLFWALRIKEFQLNKSRISENSSTIQIDNEDDFDIDNIEDFEVFKTKFLIKMQKDKWYYNLFSDLSDFSSMFYSSLHSHLSPITSIDKQCLSGVRNAGNLIKTAIGQGKKVIFMGNGGSAADSQHLATEFISKLDLDRHPLPAIALTTDTSVLTAIVNDYGYDQMFARQISALCNESDAVVGISTSGISNNVIEALKVAKKLGARTIMMTSSKCKQEYEFIDEMIKVKSENTAAIQEQHIFWGHLLIKYAESAHV
jgi:D-sedoheptulose 7-phosphate isomerase